MPGDLSPAAAAVWSCVVADLRTAGTLASVDGKALRTLCESWVAYQRATDDVEAHGILITEKTAAGMTRLRKNPAVEARHSLFKEITTLLRQFGLTPSARTGLKSGSQPASGKPGEADRVRDILKLTAG